MIERVRLTREDSIWVRADDSVVQCYCEVGRYQTSVKLIKDEAK